MKSLLQWFDRSTLASKFFLLGIFCLLVLAFPAWLYWSEARKSIEFSQEEIRGLAPAKSVLKVIQRTQQFRGMLVLALKNGSTSSDLKAILLHRAQETDIALNYATQMVQATHQSKLIASMDEINEHWNLLKRQGLEGQMDWHSYFVAMADLVRSQLDLLQSVIDVHQLSLDPEADGYFLISASLMQIPELTEALGQMRALGATYLTEKSINENQRGQIGALLALSRDKLSSINSTLDKVVLANGERGKSIFTQYLATQEQHAAITTIVNRELLSKTQLSFQADDFFSAFTLCINSYFSYIDYSIDEIQHVLQERIAKQSSHIHALIFYFSLALIGFIAFALFFVRRLIHQLGGEPTYASQIVKRITQGKLDEDIFTQYPDSLLADMQKMQLKLQENERLKNEFVSTVSHELRTPLTAMSGALSITLSGKLGELPSQMREILSIAHRNSLRLTELINDLLDMDKLSSGQVILKREKLDLLLSMRQTVKNLSAYADKFNIHLEFVTSIGSLEIESDESRLQQVLTNLVSNAIKFSPPNETVYVNLSNTGAAARVEVVDQGSGIPEEFRSRVFQKFSQADSSDRRVQGGTGLGLAISKAIMTQLGGKIGFHSSQGIGSCFYFEVPLAKPNENSVNP